MEDHDKNLERRIRDIIAVATDDIDAIMVEVEDGVAYIEGIVESEEQRRQIVNSVRQNLPVRRVITCLVAEHVVAQPGKWAATELLPPPVLMHYHSLS